MRHRTLVSRGYPIAYANDDAGRATVGLGVGKGRLGMLCVGIALGGPPGIGMGIAAGGPVDRDRA